MYVYLHLCNVYQILIVYNFVLKVIFIDPIIKL